LTGIHPRQLGEDGEGEISWQDYADYLDPELRTVISRMVRCDFRERYVDAAEALAALENLPASVSEDAVDHYPLVEPTLPEALQVSNTATTMAQAITASQNSATVSQLATVSQDETVSSLSGQLSGQLAKANIEANNGKADAGFTAEEPVSTAIWAPTESMIHAMQNGRTGLTQAVGRPHLTDSEASANSSGTNAIRRSLRPWIMLGLGGLGLVLVSMQAFPNWSNSLLGRNPAATATGETTVFTPEQQANALVAKAMTLSQNKQYDQALKIYDQAIGLKPNFAEAYAGRCEMLNQLQRPEEAIVACNDALAYKPNYPEALWSQGNARLLQNRPYEARRLYEEVTERQPDFASGWIKRGVALQKLGRSAEALVALEQAIKLERNSPEAWMTQGQALMNLQRYDDALAGIDKALQLQPNDAATLKLRQQLVKNMAK
jgi:tetratricopeptide (TPR) repeat protein